MCTRMTADLRLIDTVPVKFVEVETMLRGTQTAQDTALDAESFTRIGGMNLALSAVLGAAYRFRPDGTGPGNRYLTYDPLRMTAAIRIRNLS